MPRLIDADELQEEYKKHHDGKRLLLIDVAQTVEPQPQWIPYEDDTLPEIDEEICVIDIDDNVNWTHRTKYSDWLYDPFGNHLKNIVGWFPLPKMKKEHKGGTDTRGEEDADKQKILSHVFPY